MPAHDGLHSHDACAVEEEAAPQLEPPPARLNRDRGPPLCRAAAARLRAPGKALDADRRCLGLRNKFKPP